MEKLPKTYVDFRERFPKLAESYDAIGAASRDAGPLDEKTCQLVKLALAVGARQEGSVHSHTHRAVNAGASTEELLQVVALAVTSIGFAPAVAAYSWIQEALAKNPSS